MVIYIYLYYYKNISFPICLYDEDNENIANDLSRVRFT